MENSSNMDKSSSKNLPASKVKAPAAKKANNKVFKKMATGNTKKMSLAKTPAKKQATALKKSNTSSEGLKTRTASNNATLDSLMANFQSDEGRRSKTALGMPLKDLSESATALLMSYKVEDEKILSTTALAM